MTALPIDKTRARRRRRGRGRPAAGQASTGQPITGQPGAGPPGVGQASAGQASASQPVLTQDGPGQGRADQVTRMPGAPAPQSAPAALSGVAALSMTFADFGVPAPLVSVLTGTGIVTPFPIQAATLLDALAGLDLL